MRRLSLSLLAVVLVATIGLGVAIDRVFVGLRGDGEGDGLDGYRRLGVELAHLLDGHRNGVPPEFLAVPEAVSSSSAAPSGERVLRFLDADAFALPPELAARFSAGEVLALDSERGVTLYANLPASGRVLALSPPLAAGDEIGLRVALTGAFYGGVALLLLAWLLPLARRLRALSAGARAFGRGELDRRVATDRTSGIHDIEREFNRMAARVQDLVEDNRLLSGAVSHDLRTPLARLRFGVGALAEGPPEAERERYLRWLEEDVGSMEELVDVLLEFTRLGGGPERAASSDLALEPLIGDGVAHARTTSGREIRWHPGAGHAVRAHAPHVRMLVINLLQNAARHAGSRVEVGLARRGARVVLTVEDDGPGIAPADRARVLRPFERGRSACARGHGLGLAIVQRVAERYGATLAIDASPTLGGARIEVGFAVA